MENENCFAQQTASAVKQHIMMQKACDFLQAKLCYGPLCLQNDSVNGPIVLEESMCAMTYIIEKPCLNLRLCWDTVCEMRRIYPLNCRMYVTSAENGYLCLHVILCTGEYERCDSFNATLSDSGRPSKVTFEDLLQEIFECQVTELDDFKSIKTVTYKVPRTFSGHLEVGEILNRMTNMCHRLAYRYDMHIPRQGTVKDSRDIEIDIYVTYLGGVTQNTSPLIASCTVNYHVSTLVVVASALAVGAVLMFGYFW